MRPVDYKTSIQTTIDSKLKQLLDTLPQSVQECDRDGKIYYIYKTHHNLIKTNFLRVNLI